MKQNHIPAPLFLLVLVLGACQSRVNEPAPEKVSPAAISIEERVKAGQGIDQKLSDLQMVTDRVRQTIETFRRFQKDQSMEVSYSVVDFLYDVATELKQPLPEGDGKSFTKRSSITLPLKGLPPGCEHVNLRLKVDAQPLPSQATQSSGNEVVGSARPASQTLLLTARTCQTNNQYVPVVTASITDETITFHFDGSGLHKIFEWQGFPEAPDQSCLIRLDGAGVLKNLSCTDLEFALGSGDILRMRKLTYDPGGDPRFSFDASFFAGSGKIKARSAFSIDSHGDPHFAVESDIDTAQASGTTP